MWCWPRWPAGVGSAESLAEDPFGFDPAAAAVVVPAPGDGPGNWAGAACATVAADGTILLAWRERRPLTAGRGVAVLIARSSDGISVEVVARIERQAFGAESFERPALVELPDGRWRIYLSCATPDSKHWWIDSLTADTIEQLPSARRRPVLAGSAALGVKDPVLRRTGAGWQMFVCCHPLDVPAAEDRMTTRLATSPDGLDWTDRGAVLTPTAGSWDARGARITALLPDPAAGDDDLPALVTYDGRPDAGSNWYETTGLARWDAERYRPVPGSRERSPASDGALRYATWFALPDGGRRWYAEAARPDGAHDLVSWIAAPGR